MVVVFIDDRMDHDGLLVDRESGVCGDDDPVIYGGQLFLPLENPCVGTHRVQKSTAH